MSYVPSWTNQDQDGHVLAGQWVNATDVNELRAALNRRIKLLFNLSGAWPAGSAVAAGQWASAVPIAAARAGFGGLLPSQFAYFQRGPGWWQLFEPLYWLCPRPGDHENKFIVADTKPPQTGEVGFFALLNGLGGWAGQLAANPIRAADINELRDAAALLSRGRFVLRVGDGGSAKASRALPSGLWYPPAVARSASDEMRSWFGGRGWLWTPDGAGGWHGTRGQAVTVRSSSKIRLKPQGDNIRVKLYRCKRNVNTSNFSWSQYDAQAGLNWQTPGGAGGDDAAHIRDLDLIDDTWTEHSDGDFIAALQAMADGGAEPTFMLAPNQQTGWPSEPIHILVEVVLDFDLACPPG